MSIELIESPPAVFLRTFEAPALGTHWPEQGGIYAGLVRGENGVDHHLVISIDPLGAFEDAVWGERGQDVAGATSKSDGLTNTRAMAAAGSEIAQKVLALRIGGHEDWHIPSQADAHVAFANCAELFEKRDWYWTSTQYSRSYAFVQAFELGSSHWNGKDFEFRVRAVRRIQLQPFNASALAGA